MFKIKPFILFGVNISLMVLSWIFYKYPQGDEYLVLFIIPLVFLFVPYVMSFTATGIMLLVNIVFLVFCRRLDMLNAVDISVLGTLFTVFLAGSYLMKYMHGSFDEYHRANIHGRQQRYNSIVNELEAIDRRGRVIENELSRISRLYEVTEKLVPALKFEDLLDSLFEFIEDNFKFKTIHLLTFSKEKFVKSISKSKGDIKYRENDKEGLDYEKFIEYSKKREYDPFFIYRSDNSEVFGALGINTDMFMSFPLFVSDKLCAILAIEGASKASYGRFRILTPQIALELKKVELYEEVQELSIIDGLTEVYLRRYLMDRLEEEVERAGRLGLTFSIGMVDVDFFKACNDKYGHLVGDAVLKKIAERLKKSVREVDMISRYGGEEFCIILPDTTKEFAVSVADRLRRSIEKKHIKAFDEEIGITVSIGISTYPEDGKTAHVLLEKADTALYKAKIKGRNTVCTV